MIRYLLIIAVLLSACASPAAAKTQTWAVDSFFDIEYRIDESSQPIPVHLDATGSAVIRASDPQPQADGSMTFDTEMLSMSLTGFNPSLGAVQIRESPTRPSLGKLLFDPVTGGIDSFFDVFTELSMDGGRVIRNLEPWHYSGMSDSFFDITYRIDFVGPLPLHLYDGDTVVGELHGSEMRMVLPEPGSVLALSAGLCGLCGVVLRRRK
jgi:hypothetical protein